MVHGRMVNVETLVQLPLLVVALLVFLVLATVEGSVLYRHLPRPLQEASLWVRTHILPGMWRPLERLNARLVSAVEDWWERDPAEQRGELAPLDEQPSEAPPTAAPPPSPR